MSQQNCIVEQSFDRCAVTSLCTSQLREKLGRFVGSIMNHHAIKPKVEQLDQKFGAGTSASVLADILGSCEELRWMEPHMSSPSPCL